MCVGGGGGGGVEMVVGLDVDHTCKEIVLIENVFIFAFSYGNNYSEPKRKTLKRLLTHKNDFLQVLVTSCPNRILIPSFFPEFEVTMYTRYTHPHPGQIIKIFLYYFLPAAYVRDPYLVPDFNWQVFTIIVDIVAVSCLCFKIWLVS